MVMFPDFTVTLAWMRTRSSGVTPSSSKNDSASYTPSASLATKLRPCAEAGARPADVDPVRPHHGEREQLALEEVREVDHDVVKVLPRHRLVVGDDDVARLETLPAVALHSVGDDDAQVRDEMGNAPDVLADQLPVDIDECGTEVPHLVDHHVLRSALHVPRHLVGDRGYRVADDFRRPRIQFRPHPPPPTQTIPSPVL